MFVVWGKFFNGNRLLFLKFNKWKWICFGVFWCERFIVIVCNIVDFLYFGFVNIVVWLVFIKL